MDRRFTLENIDAAAAEFLAVVSNKKVIALHGEMGAGKTTFVHAVCDRLGVRETVSSPTFSIVNEYRSANDKTLYHLDLYRIKDEQEALAAGVEECFYSGAMCFAEWPEIIPALFPENTVHCYLSVTGNNERRLQIKL